MDIDIEEQVDVFEGAFVYFFQSERAVKIGTAKNLRVRLAQIQANNPSALVVRLVLLGGLHREKRIQRRFKDSRIHGEWFSLTEEIEQFISAMQPQAIPERAPIDEATVAAFWNDRIREAYEKVQW